MELTFMFNKKFKLFLITLAFMLSISAVAAADSNSTDDILAEEVDVEPPSGSPDLLSVSEEAKTASSNANYQLTSEAASYYSGSNYTVVLSQNNNPVKDAQVSLKVNGITYTQNTDDDGKVSVPLDLDAGNYVISTTYGDVVDKSNVKVLPVVVGKDVTKTYSSSKKYSATFLTTNGTPLKNTKVKFILNNKTYNKKTNSKGVASLELNLKVGTYNVTAVHPNGYRTTNKVTVKSSVVAKDVTKHYLSSKAFTATFYGKNGKPLAKKYIKFKAHGINFNVKTNSKGVAKLSIISDPSTFKLTSINSETGEKVTRTVKILPTMSAKKMTVFSDKTSKFKVTLYKNEKLVKNAKVYVYIKGVKKLGKTDEKGVATIKFKLAKGNYTFKSYDPYTQSYISTKITVNDPTIKASNIVAAENKTSVFTATLLNTDGSLAKNTDMQITFNNVTKTVKTNAYGAASINFNLTVGTYKVTCKDLRNGYSTTKTIKVIPSNVGKAYDSNGVSEDGYSLLAIGRASSSGELSKYGYTFYAVELDRTCPYCASHDLYWSIFFAGNEYSNWGKFPATGNSEGSSAEGIIVCANCDSDWSIFGHNHGGSGGDLTVITPAKSCTKEDAYKLLNDEYMAS
jgi:hypothetical protein